MLTFKQYLTAGLFVLFLLFHRNVHADVVVVVSQYSSLTNLTKDQLKQIFLGYTDVIQGIVVIPIEPSDNDELVEEFHSKITGKSLSQIKAHWAKLVFSGISTPPKRVRTPEALKKLISDNVNTIGYIDRKYVDKSVKIIYVDK